MLPQTTLCLNVGFRQLMLYFDLNGGMAKIPQADVTEFLKIVKSEKVCRKSDDQRQAVMERIIHALLCARAAFVLTLHNANWSLTDIIFAQLFATQHCVPLFHHFVQHECDHLEQLAAKQPLIVVFDEVQRLLCNDSWTIFPSSTSAKRPLAVALARAVVAVNDAQCVVCGTSVDGTKFQETFPTCFGARPTVGTGATAAVGAAGAETAVLEAADEAADEAGRRAQSISRRMFPGVVYLASAGKSCCGHL